MLAAHVMPLQMTTPATPISISIRRTPSLAAPNGLAGILTFVLDAVRAQEKKIDTNSSIHSFRNERDVGQDEADERGGPGGGGQGVRVDRAGEDGMM